MLPEGATPTTSRVTLVNGAEAAEQVVDESFAILYLHCRSSRTQYCNTPGTNALSANMNASQRYVSRAVTWSYSPLRLIIHDRKQRLFLNNLAWGKKVSSC